MHEIEKLAVKCLETDYSEPQSVKEHNNAALKIRELINNINDEKLMIQFLNNKNTSSWAAFQNLENPEKCSKIVFENSINALKIISKEESPESMAAEMRLKELRIKS